MSPIEDFFRELDDGWTSTSPAPIPLHIIGSTALMLQTDYQRGTRDSDVLETTELSEGTKVRLLAMAGPGTELHRRYRLYVEIVAYGIPFLAWPPVWKPVNGLNGGLRRFQVHVLDVVDVVVSKLKRLSPSDLTDIDAMVDRGLVPHHALIERFRSAVDSFSLDGRAEQLPTYVAHLHRVERDMLGVTETEIELPGWI